jgi:hypothetical protein
MFDWLKPKKKGIKPKGYVWSGGKLINLNTLNKNDKSESKF